MDKVDCSCWFSLYCIFSSNNVYFLNFKYKEIRQRGTLTNFTVLYKRVNSICTLTTRHVSFMFT